MICGDFFCVGVDTPRTRACVRSDAGRIASRVFRDNRFQIVVSKLFSAAGASLCAVVARPCVRGCCRALAPLGVDRALVFRIANGYPHMRLLRGA